MRIGGLSSRSDHLRGAIERVDLLGPLSEPRRERSDATADIQHLPDGCGNERSNTRR